MRTSSLAALAAALALFAASFAAVAQDKPAVPAKAVPPPAAVQAPPQVRPAPPAAGPSDAGAQDLQQRQKLGKELHREFNREMGGDVLPEGLPPPPPSDGSPNFELIRRSVEIGLSEDEKSNLRRLAFEKPDEFRDEMKKRFQAVRQKRLEEFRKTGELQKAYRDAPNQDAKQKALEDLRKMVQDQFLQKMELNKRRLDDTEKSLDEAQRRLEDFRRKYEERKSKADEIINERVKDLIRDPDLDW